MVGWISGIATSIVLNIANYMKWIPQLATNPIVDIVVKGILFGFVIIVAKEVLPV